MGGVVRRIKRAVDEVAKVVDTPSQEPAAAAPAPAVEPVAMVEPAPVVEAPDPASPADVVYSGEGEMATGRRRRRRRASTILTSSQGVMGEAPTQKKNLLGS